MQKYALDNKTLLVIELATFAIFEYKRYDNFKKKGQVLHTVCKVNYTCFPRTSPFCEPLRQY